MRLKGPDRLDKSIMNPIYIIIYIIFFAGRTISIFSIVNSKCHIVREAVFNDTIKTLETLVVTCTACLQSGHLSGICLYNVCIEVNKQVSTPKLLYNIIKLYEIFDAVIDLYRKTDEQCMLSAVDLAVNIVMVYDVSLQPACSFL